MAPPFPMMIMKAFLQRKGRLSDIEYLAIKEADGKLKHNEGALAADTTGTLCTITVTDGNDGYLAQAQINIRAANGAAGTVKAELQAEQSNGVFTIVDTWVSGRNVTNESFKDHYEFKNIGHKIVGDGNTLVFRIEVTVLGAGISAEGNITVIEETAGTSPAV